MVQVVPPTRVTLVTSMVEPEVPGAPQVEVV